MMKQNNCNKCPIGEKRYLTGLIALFALISCAFSVSGDVFSLFPFSGRDGKIWGVDALGGSKLWVEPIEVNGIALKMRVTLQKQTLQELYILLKKKFPDASFKNNAESLLVQIPRLNGMTERIYLVATKGEKFFAIQFSMELPADIPKDPEWLEDLPIPAGATIIETMAMPNRELEYGVFSTNISPGSAIAELTSIMISKGWVEIQSGIMATKDKKRIMLFNVSENDNGVTTGFVISRPLLGTNIK